MVIEQKIGHSDILQIGSHSERAGADALPKLGLWGDSVRNKNYILYFFSCILDQEQRRSNRRGRGRGRGRRRGRGRGHGGGAHNGLGV